MDLSRNFGDAVKRFWIASLAAAAVAAASTTAVYAQGGVDKARAAAFDKRMFAGPIGQKTYACFVRRYDASHLAQHPKQKVSAMKLLVTAENPPEEKTTNYSFRLGVKYRHRAGNFDSSGYCSHVVAEDTGNEIRFGCGVDCEGGGIDVAMAKDDKSAIIRLRADHALGTQQAGRRTPSNAWWPAPTTRFSGSTAPTCANVPSS